MDTLISLIEKLAGQIVPFPQNKLMFQGRDPFLGDGIDYSQFNEMLLTLGYDRVSRDFFSYLFNDKPTINSYKELEEGVDKFRKLAMLLYGNIKFAFKTLSKDSYELQKAVQETSPLTEEEIKKKYENRPPEPIHKIEEIKPEYTYYLGLIVEREVESQLSVDPNNTSLLQKKALMEEIQKIGKANYNAYLTHDHMDVYIATSMRERHEYYMVHNFIKELFDHNEIKKLRLRWFDPTLAYCKDRIDKGLVEGLMVKRAKCTIYHIQETDTFGKDSELAATLAQGKPVIAYIPKLSQREQFLREANELVKTLYPDDSPQNLILRFLQRYYPGGAWENPKVRKWLDNPSGIDITEALNFLFEKAQALYEKRAKTLCDDHPLALQVNLENGVANGILVVRTVADCAKLLRRIILNNMEFNIEEEMQDGKITLLLREKISGCVFRVVTGDELLTNTFWNFYVDKFYGSSSFAED